MQYNIDIPLKNNIDELHNKLVEMKTGITLSDPSAYAVPVEWLAEMLDNVIQATIFSASKPPSDETHAICNMANAISISLGDELRMGAEMSAIRQELFGADDCEGIQSMNEYIEAMVGDRPDIKRIDHRRCKSCGQTYNIWLPADVWGNSKQIARTNLSNASFEFIFLSGLCDACWQKAFNRKD